MKTFFKTVFRTINNNKTRFLAMIAIVVLGVGFTTGLGATVPNMRDAQDKYYDAYSTPDIIVKAPMGFSTAQKDILQNNPLIESSEELFCNDIKLNDVNTRVYIMPLQNAVINKVDLIEGDFPKSENEILIERTTHYLKSVEINSIIDYNGQSLTVSGIIVNPLFFCKEKEPSYIEDEHLEMIIYFDSAFTSPPVNTDIFIRVNGAADKNTFSKAYKALINQCKDSLAVFQSDANPLVFLTFDENASYALYKSNLDKIEIISYIFPMFFLLVAALVVLTTMTRLAEEERTAIGCYSTLGYNNSTIKWKYLFYAFSCGILGSLIGIGVGCRIIPMLVYTVYAALFTLPPLTSGFFYAVGFIAAAVMTITLILVTLIVVSSILKNKPAELLKQKAPKAGKTIFLEKVTFIWKRLKFKYKSTFRNIFRYVQHFVMTVVSIAGCTALVLAGIGLFDSVNKTSEMQSFEPRLLDSIVLVAILLVVSAGILSFIVIYNLTNMNIEERKKEIATLKVLGYHDSEVTSYIFREIFIISCFGIFIGLPLGYGFLHLVLVFMKSDAISFVTHINWYTWPLCIILNFIFTAIVDLLLYRKIIKIDMNASLKANE